MIDVKEIMSKEGDCVTVDASQYLKLTKYEDIKTSDPIINKYLRAKLLSNRAGEIGISFDWKKFRK